MVAPGAIYFKLYCQETDSNLRGSKAAVGQLMFLPTITLVASMTKDFLSVESQQNAAVAWAAGNGNNLSEATIRKQHRKRLRFHSERNSFLKYDR